MNNRVFALLLIILFVLGFAASAAAFPGFPGNGGMMPPPDGAKGPTPLSQEELKSTLDKLVSEGTINKDQEDKILNHLTNQMPPTAPPKNGQPDGKPDPAGHKSPLSQLVTDNIITQQQAAAIEQALFKGKMPNHGGDSVTIAETSTAAFSLKGQKADKASQTFTASHQDESGIKVSGISTLNLSNARIETSGNSSSDENSNFYGLNAGLLAESGSTINIKASTISTVGNGANAVFATGSGSLISLSNVKIKTSGDSARGLDATLKGTVKAANIDITTKGMHCAALATDRGNGTIIVEGGTMTTAGEGSPGIYSTGDIHVTNATLTATGSEAAVIEGKNSITLKNTNLSGAKLWGVMLYQSFSGDAEVGISRFTMKGGLLTAATGPAFYVTNTQASIELTDASILAPSGILIKAGANKWGTTGSNGGTLTFTANHEILAGNILCDTISLVTTSLKNNTAFTGTINPENTGSVALALDRGSYWNVTGNSYLSSLADEDNLLANIRDNGFTIYYDSSLASNSWLKGETYTLRDGGKLMPK